jgi:hypothetical protein
MWGAEAAEILVVRVNGRCFRPADKLPAAAVIILKNGAVGTAERAEVNRARRTFPRLRVQDVVSAEKGRSARLPAIVDIDGETYRSTE